MFGFEELIIPCKLKKEDNNLFNYLTITGPLQKLEDLNKNLLSM